VEGKEDQAVAAKLSEAAAAPLEGAADNGIAFDHGKTEAVFISLTAWWSFRVSWEFS
jgi:hypothetical protein